MPTPFSPEVLWRNLALARRARRTATVTELAESRPGAATVRFESRGWKGTVVLDLTGAGRHSCSCPKGRIPVVLGALEGSLCAHVISAFLATGREEALLPYTVAAAPALTSEVKARVLLWERVTSGKSRVASFVVYRALDFNGETVYKTVRR